MARREFLRQAILATAGTMLLGACGTGDLSTGVLPADDLAAITGMRIAIDRYPSLAAIGGIATIPVVGGEIALVRRALTVFESFWLDCPHQGTTLHVDSTGFVCPNHGAHYSADGVWRGGFVTPNLKSVPLSYDAASGTVTLGVAPPVTTPVRTPMVVVLTLANVAPLSTVGGIDIIGTGNGYPAAIVRVADAEYIAVSISCPHAGYYVEPAGSGFLCPGHGAEFSSRGVWTGGYATSSLTPLASRYDAAAGTLTVTIP